MRKPKNILEALGIVDFDDDLENGVKLGQKVVSGQDCPTHKEEPKEKNKTDLEGMSAEVAGIAALVKLLSAAVEAAEEDEKKEEDEENEDPIKLVPSNQGCMVTPTKNEVDREFAKRKCEESEKKRIKGSLVGGHSFASCSRRNCDTSSSLADILSEKKRKLVLHDTVEQEAEALAQGHKKILDALSQVEPDGMDYHMIKEMVKYIDILHSVRCSAERVASILAKD